MCDDADYSYSVQSERFPRARKEHRCYACREPIRIGDKYAYSVAIGQEGFDSYKHCLRCYTMLEAIQEAHSRNGSAAVRTGPTRSASCQTRLRVLPSSPMTKSNSSR